MGHYTKFYCTCQIKKEYEKELSRMYLRDLLWDESPYPLFKKFGEDERSVYINLKPRESYIFEGDVWNFKGDLKNYDKTIENFIENVLNEVVETLHLCYTLYENDSYETIYEMKENGKINKL